MKFIGYGKFYSKSGELVEFEKGSFYQTDNPETQKELFDLGYNLCEVCINMKPTEKPKGRPKGRPRKAKNNG